jgi:GTPase
MIPVIAIVGRPNVGKSTLFNCLTLSKNALVIDLPGTTRDRIYGEGKVGDFPYIVVDTGGVGENTEDIDELMSEQSWVAVKEADLVLFVVDAGLGVAQADLAIAKKLRPLNKSVLLVINKIDGRDSNVVIAEFYKLGFKDPIAISARDTRGIHKLVDSLQQYLPSKPVVAEAELEPELDQQHETAETSEVLEPKPKIKVAIVGRPNVGKSTLVNRLLGEERVVMCDQPGTTRDSIYINFTKNNREFILIDTAGMRKRARIEDGIEKFSLIKALQAIEACNVAILVIDANREISDQDLHILKFVIDAGKSLVIGINKWDGLKPEQREKIKAELSYKLNFINFVKHHFISAKHGTAVGVLFDSVIDAYNSATRKHSTNKLTTILHELAAQHSPPSVNGRAIKLRYAHMGGLNPPSIVIHGNQTEGVPESYKRYLANAFIKILKLQGTPIKISFKTGDNPYKGNKNILTERQVKRRQRLIKHSKRGR